MGLVSVLWARRRATRSRSAARRQGWIGNFDFACLTDADTTAATGFGAADPAARRSSAFQMMFAIITPALITGAIADRMRFSAWVVVHRRCGRSLVYAPVAHWVFSPAGWLSERGALDFAGGTVVHINAGIAALAVVLVLGKRTGWPQHPMPPHSLPLTLLGTGILWFGWFGFNAGSALGANGVAAQAFMNTILAAAAAMLGWLLVERIQRRARHHARRGVGRGRRARGDHAVRRLRRRHGADRHRRSIAGVVCYFAVSVKFKFGYDDALDVVGVHLVGGLLGSLLLGLFADARVQPGGRAPRACSSTAAAGS